MDTWSLNPILLKKNLLSNWSLERADALVSKHVYMQCKFTSLSSFGC